MIANCAFPYSVLATSSRNGQCLSELMRVSVGGGGYVFVTSSVRSALDSDAELFMYLFNVLGSAHEKFGIWTRP